MKAWSLLLLAALAALPLSGCLGAPNAEATSARYQPYTKYALMQVPDLEAREPACDPQGRCSEYYVVEIHGSENATLVAGPDVLAPCHKDWLFDADPAAKTLTYNASRYPNLDPGDINTVVVEDVWGIAFGSNVALHDCPTLYGLRDYPRTPPPAHKRIIGSYGLVDVKVFRAGTLSVGLDHTFDIGQKLVVSYGRVRTTGDTTYFVQGGFEIANLGPWPLSGLRPGTGALTP